MSSATAYLAPIPLFSKLSADELAVIAARLKHQSFPMGEVIFKQGEQGDAMFIIRSGRVRIYSQDEGGQELTLNVYEGGDFFGEFSIIDGEPRSASAEAVEATEAMVLRSQDLISILDDHPDIAISLMRGLVSRLRYTTEYAEDLAATMLATTLGVEFNSDTDWNEREDIYKMSGKIVRTFNITQSAQGDKNGLWTTVIAAAILLP